MVQVVIFASYDFWGKSGHQQTFFQSIDCGYFDWFTVERCTLPLFCNKQFVEIGIVNDTNNQFAVVFQSNRNTITGITVRVVE